MENSVSKIDFAKLGTLEQLLVEHGPTRDDVLAWAKNEGKIETEKYKKEKEMKTVLIPFHSDRQLDYDQQFFYRGGHLFLQAVYYQMQINKICQKLKQKYQFKNAAWSRQKSIKTAISWGKGMIRSSTMTVRIIISRLNNYSNGAVHGW